MRLLRATRRALARQRAIVASWFSPPDWRQEDELLAQLEQEARDRTSQPGWNLPDDYNQYVATDRVYAGGQMVQVGEIRRGNRFRLWRLALVGWATLVILVGIDIVAFRAIGLDYFHWYLATGAALSLAFAIVAAVGIDLDEYDEFISPHPYEYLTGWVLLGAYWLRLWQALQRPQHLISTRYRSLRLDRGIAQILWAILAALAVAWIGVVSPLQYLVNLVCGAPARMARGSQDTVWLRKRQSWLPNYRNPTRYQPVLQAKAMVKPSRGALEAGFQTKPVTVTHLIGAILLAALSAISS